MPTHATSSDATETPAPGDVPATMTALTARTYGGPKVLTQEEIPVPVPSEGEVLVEVEATALNPLDWHFLNGTPYVARPVFGLRRPKRVVPGADVAGVVVRTGPGSSRFAVGSRVFGESGGGGLGAYAAVKEDSLALVPAGVSAVAAAATPVAGLTALQGLRDHGAVAAGDRVLVNGAAGGVGTMAVQIARAFDAEVTAVCSTRNVDMVRALGADHVVDYTREDFTDTDARFDVMLDNVGNRRPHEVRDLMRPGGRYVAVSGPKANRWLDPLPYIVRAKAAFVRGHASFHNFTAAPNPDDLTLLGEFLRSGQVVPQIDRVIGLDAVAEALAEIGSGHARAKIVVAPRNEGSSPR